MSPSKPSLHDVAAAAGVSVSTVSRYLKGQLALKAETERRVVDTMHELGYEPAQRRRATPRDGGVIGLVVPQIGSTYFGRIADAVVKSAEAQGFSVLMASTLSHARKENDYVELLASTAIDGLIYAGNHRSNRALAHRAQSGLPLVVIDEEISGLPPVDTVLVDDYAGAYHATTYLATLGHTDIALVAGPASLRSVRERTRGYSEALLNSGIDPEVQLRMNGPFSEDFGGAALSRLRAASRRPTAVFAASDTLAMGMIMAASTLGVRVPDDLSIVGFDDVPHAAIVSPGLTTVRTPVEKMAASAVTALTERIDDPTRETAITIVPVSLVLRDSAAPPGS